jgi:hypothetical protein
MEQDEVEFRNKMAQYACSCSKTSCFLQALQVTGFSRTLFPFQAIHKTGRQFIEPFLADVEYREAVYSSRNNRRAPCSGRNNAA